MPRALLCVVLAVWCLAGAATAEEVSAPVDLAAFPTVAAAVSLEFDVPRFTYLRVTLRDGSSIEGSFHRRTDEYLFLHRGGFFLNHRQRIPLSEITSAVRAEPPPRNAKADPTILRIGLFVGTAWWHRPAGGTSFREAQTADLSGITWRLYLSGLVGHLHVSGDPRWLNEDNDYFERRNLIVRWGVTGPTSVHGLPWLGSVFVGGKYIDYEYSRGRRFEEHEHSLGVGLKFDLLGFSDLALTLRVETTPEDPTLYAELFWLRQLSIAGLHLHTDGSIELQRFIDLGFDPSNGEIRDMGHYRTWLRTELAIDLLDADWLFGVMGYDWTHTYNEFSTSRPYPDRPPDEHYVWVGFEIEGGSRAPMGQR